MCAKASTNTTFCAPQCFAATTNLNVQSYGTASSRPVRALNCRLLRWGTSTAAELAAADAAHAGQQLPTETDQTDRVDQSWPMLSPTEAASPSHSLSTGSEVNSPAARAASR